MGNKIKLSHIILVAVILAAIHIILLRTRAYGNNNWVDIPLHIVAGLFLGLIFLWWQSRAKNTDVIGHKSLVMGLFLFGLIGGLLWEGIEVMLWKFFPIIGNYVQIKSAPLSDFFSDLAFGSLGSLVWLVFVKPQRFNKNYEK